jgi:AcrR family transcriptional regulator
MTNEVARKRVGRPPAATRQELLAEATDRYLHGERVELQDVALRLGLARMTVYRWFGSRDGLIGEVIASLGEGLVDTAARRVRRHGRSALLEIFGRVNRDVAASSALRSYMRREGLGALRVLTASDGIVHPRMVASIERVIRAELAYEADVIRIDPSTLAFAIVRLAESFLYNDAASDIRGDVERLREVQAALLGI